MLFGSLDRIGRQPPELFLERPELLPRPLRLGIEPHAPVTVLSPRAGTQAKCIVGPGAIQMRRGSERSNSALQIDFPIKLLNEVDSLEPPVSEELGVERRHDQLASLHPYRGAHAAQKLGEVL